MIARGFFLLLKSEILSISHALVTPTFPSGTNHEIVADYVENLMMVHYFFTLLQPDMPMDGVRSGQCDKSLSQKLDYLHFHTKE